VGEHPDSRFDRELPPEVEYPPDGSEPGRFDSWRKRSAIGAMMTGLALGLREVVEPEREEPGIMLETSGVPPKQLPVEAEIDAVPPRQSVVKVRPWLLDDRAEHAPTPAAGSLPEGQVGAALAGGEPAGRDPTAVPARAGRRRARWRR
jgi:hypothetical protein